MSACVHVQRMRSRPNRATQYHAPVWVPLVLDVHVRRRVGLTDLVTRAQVEASLAPVFALGGCTATTLGPTALRGAAGRHAVCGVARAKPYRAINATRHQRLGGEDCAARPVTVGLGSRENPHCPEAPPYARARNGACLCVVRNARDACVPAGRSRVNSCCRPPVTHASLDAAEAELLRSTLRAL